MFPGVDWSTTQAYGLGMNGLYLNLAGREKHGAVRSQSQGSLLAEIRDKLLEVRDVDGTQRVAEAEPYFKKAAASGEPARQLLLADYYAVARRSAEVEPLLDKLAKDPAYGPEAKTRLSALRLSQGRVDEAEAIGPSRDFDATSLSAAARWHFGEDVQAYLEGRSVSARPDGLAEAGPQHDGFHAAFVEYVGHLVADAGDGDVVAHVDRRDHAARVGLDLDREARAVRAERRRGHKGRRPRDQSCRRAGRRGAARPAIHRPDDRRVPVR
mgnify:CR=1 FL=1